MNLVAVENAMVLQAVRESSSKAGSLSDDVVISVSTDEL